MAAALSKRAFKNHTLLTVKQFKGRDTEEKTFKLKFEFEGNPVKKVTCTYFSETTGDESEAEALEKRVASEIQRNPNASANALVKAVGGNRKAVLAAIKKFKGGSDSTVQ